MYGRECVPLLQGGDKCTGRTLVVSLSNSTSTNNMANNKNQAQAQPLDPNVTHAAMWQVNNFLNQEVTAYDNYTADLERQVRTQEWRATAWEERAQVYRRQLDEAWTAQARARAGGETIVSAIDNMYNLFIEMVREAPQIGHYHTMLQRIVLHAEAGRRMMDPVVDLTEEEEDDDANIFFDPRIGVYREETNGHTVTVVQETTMVIDLTSDEE